MSLNYMKICLLSGVLLCASCVPCIGPRVCTSLPAGPLVQIPPGWVAAAENMPTIDTADALLAARLCLLAYDTSSTHERIRQLGDVHVVDVDDISIDRDGRSVPLAGLRFFVWYDTLHGRQHVSVRGTMNVENVFEDALYFKVKDDLLGLYVHVGAYAVAMRLIDTLATSLRPDLQTWITGHSLGGAAAVLLYLHLYEQNAAQLAPLITFGQIRALECCGVTKYRCLPVIRFVNWNDPAPWLPPSREQCTNKFDPGCHGTFAQLGDEIEMSTPGASWRYATDQCVLSSMESRLVRVLEQVASDGVLDSAERESLRADLKMHLPDVYYDKLLRHVRSLPAGRPPWSFEPCCPAGSGRCGCP